ncbi:tRNA-dihydrouridine(20) synthase [NAD(P)+]-like [Asparagus officinalis]|uniref:tRNA-dihydrouridine synthase n=1 Tax=Asparagus officinalis TaxID=4686 RepID=A0A5P1F0H3_ASPOF|nr:tRNA-dihydrouridine(20) synthase [NAD(P)+]-like [Asparagus officinalis]
MDYRNKHILAPMVRVGTLPLRLLAAEYGADITYGEEIIDHKMIKCERRANETLGSVDFVERGTGSVVFRTCDEEKDRVVFQMGTSDAVRALAAAQLVCKDVAAIDINMGCPRAFSLSGGMGAALLSKPELIHDILTTLKRNLNTPVTCKIRLLKSSRDTVELAQQIERTGVSALAVHGRTILNSSSETSATSVMVARGALWNASIFCAKGKSSWSDVKREYLRKSILWDNDVKSTKHTLKEMIMHYSSLELAEGKAVIKSETDMDLAKLYGEEEYYHLVNINRP